MPPARAPARRERARAREPPTASSTLHRDIGDEDQEEPSHNSGRRMRGRCRIKAAAFGNRIAGARVSSACARLPPPSRTDAVSVAVARGGKIYTRRRWPVCRTHVYRPRKRNPTDCDSIIVNPSADRAAVFSTRARHTPGRGRSLGIPRIGSHRARSRCMPPDVRRTSEASKARFGPAPDRNPPLIHPATRARARAARRSARAFDTFTASEMAHGSHSRGGRCGEPCYAPIGSTTR